MRRLAAMAACMALGVFAGSGPAAGQTAEPTGEPGQIEVPDPVPGEEQCAITDPRLVQISGLVALEDGYLVVNDSTFFEDRQPIFLLDQACQVVDQIGFPTLPRDPEDLELDWSTNTLWVADIGDNQAAGTAEGEPRATVALWQVELDGDRTPLIHRFSYEDGQPRDAEALVLDGDGTPIIITKTIGAAELFVPAEPLRPNNPPEDAVPLQRVGEIRPPDTGSEHRLGALGRQVITGGATAPDRSAVALRTYADAFELDVVDGDVIGAITEGKPRVTPLPEEPQGESIAYSADGARLLTVSEVPDDLTEFQPVILGYTPTPPPEPTAPPAPPEQSAAGGGGLFNSVQDIINLVAAVGVLGAVLVAAGIVGIVRSRRRWARANAAGGGAGLRDAGGRSGGPPRGRVRMADATIDPAPSRMAEQEAAAGGVYSSRAARGTAAGEHWQGTGHRHPEQPEQAPFDQHWAGEHRYGYPGDEEPGGGHPPYQNEPPEYDYRADDPDYPYEFRRPGR